MKLTGPDATAEIVNSSLQLLTYSGSPTSDDISAANLIQKKKRQKERALASINAVNPTESDYCICVFTLSLALLSPTLTRPGPGRARYVFLRNNIDLDPRAGGHGRDGPPQRFGEAGTPINMQLELIWRALCHIHVGFALGYN